MHIVAEITYTCPAKCPFCPLKEEKYRRPMDLHRYRIVLELFSVYFYGRRKLLTISGGEPTVSRNLKRYVEIAKEVGYRVTVVTNGWNPERILEAKPDFVQISLDYFEGRHNLSRKLELWHNIIKLLEYVKEGKINGFIRFTLMDDNLQDLVSLRTRLDSLGLNDIKIFAMPVRGDSERAPSKETILKAMKYAILPSRCPAGRGMFVVTPDFRVLDCIFHRKELGRFEKFTIDEVRRIVEEGRKVKEYPCGEPYWWSK